MNNFSITHEGKEYWISRSMTTVGVVVAIENDNIFILANKRGKGCPDNVGLWNLPCGYLDYNEDLNQACAREVKEECGIDLDPNKFIIFGINSNPLENKQNVSVRFLLFLNGRIEIGSPSGEKDEVDDIQWIDINDISSYNWAFNHQYIIAEAIKYGKQLLQQQQNCGTTSETMEAASESNDSN